MDHRTASLLDVSAPTPVSPALLPKELRFFLPFSLPDSSSFALASFSLGAPGPPHRQYWRLRLPGGPAVGGARLVFSLWLSC